jgi:hypothetical protein
MSIDLASVSNPYFAELISSIASSDKKSGIVQPKLPMLQRQSLSQYPAPRRHQDEYFVPVPPPLPPPAPFVTPQRTVDRTRRILGIPESAPVHRPTPISYEPGTMYGRGGSGRGGRESGIESFVDRIIPVETPVRKTYRPGATLMEFIDDEDDAPRSSRPPRLSRSPARRPRPRPVFVPPPPPKRLPPIPKTKKDCNAMEKDALMKLADQHGISTINEKGRTRSKKAVCDDLIAKAKATPTPTPVKATSDTVWLQCEGDNCRELAVGDSEFCAMHEPVVGSGVYGDEDDTDDFVIPVSRRGPAAAVATPTPTAPAPTTTTRLVRCDTDGCSEIALDVSEYCFWHTPMDDDYLPEPEKLRELKRSKPRVYARGRTSVSPPPTGRGYTLAPTRRGVSPARRPVTPKGRARRSVSPARPRSQPKLTANCSNMLKADLLALAKEYGISSTDAKGKTKLKNEVCQEVLLIMRDITTPIPRTRSKTPPARARASPARARASPARARASPARKTIPPSNSACNKVLKEDLYVIARKNKVKIVNANGKPRTKKEICDDLMFLL